MSWAEVKKINSNLDTPLDELIGTDADPASESGSVHGKLKYIMENFPEIHKDPYETPGPQILSAGTMELGYFGHAVAGSLITGAALATAIGLSAGTLQNDDAGWEKFAVDGKILFVATKAVRSSVTWANLNTVGAVFGTATVNINGKTYKVRLLTGGTTDPSSGGDGGEWNILMYALHQDQAPPWARYIDADLGVGVGNGRYSWCQDTSGTSRVVRGGNSISHFSTSSPTYVYASHGWRPVLEIVSEGE